MRIKTYLTLVCLFFCALTCLHSQTQYIGPDGGDWFTVANWNNGLPANGNDALVGGGVNVTISNDLTVDFTITNFGGIVVDANIINDGAISNSGTVTFSNAASLTNNSTFNNFQIATFAGPATFNNEAGATFTNSGTFTLETTLVNKGGITNNGTIDASAGTLLTEGTFDNSQTLTTESLTVADGSTFTNNFGSNLFITGATSLLQVDGTFNNLGNVETEGIFNVVGNFSNSSSVVNKGTLTIGDLAIFNNAGGTVTNEGTAENLGSFINGFQFINKGTFTNNATFNNNNLIDNQLGGIFTSNSGALISMGFGSEIQNAGDFTNNGSLDSFGSIENPGNFVNGGTINSFSGSSIDNDGTYTNDGQISTNDQVESDGTFFNNGTIDVNGGSVWMNNGDFTNGITGTINNLQDFQSNAGATLTNNGRFTNFVRALNNGVFNNNGYLENMGNLTNETAGVLTNNELFEQLSGNLLNKGTVNNTASLFSDECSTISNDGTVDNSADFVVKAIIFQRGTLNGLEVDCQGCYVHTNATSDAPAICKNGSFGADVDGEVKVYAPELIAFANFDSCANIVYLADGVDRPVFECSDIGTTINANIVLRIPNTNDSLTCVAIITPEDVLEPQFDFCPKDIVVFTDQAGVVVDWTEPTFIDNCTNSNITASNSPGDTFPIGITGVTYTALDDYDNINNCQFRVDVRQTPPGGTCTGDTSGPSFVDCPTDISLITTGIGANASWVAPTATDDCYPLFINTDFVPGQTFGVGTTTVIYTAIDGNENESTCEFDVTVAFDDPCAVDNTAPSFSDCPANIFKPTNAITGGAVAVWSDPGTFDLCGVASVSANASSGTVFLEGVTDVVYTAEDVNGNTSTCEFTITVGDDPCPGVSSAPSFSNCPNDISIQINGNSSPVTWTAPTAVGECQPLSVNNNFDSGAEFQIGLSTVTYVVSDAKGRTATCSFNVVVEGNCTVDSELPVISNCPTNITEPAVNGSAIVSWIEPTADDNCGLISFSSTFAPGSIFPVGVTTVIYTAGDLSGNGATCEFNVAVVEAPECTTNAAPIDQTIDLDPASIDLSWNSALNADSYDIYLDTNNPPTTLVASSVNGTSTTIDNLQGGTNYFWYVVPKNDAGDATGCGSSVTTFSTLGNTGGGCNFEALFIAASTNLNTSDAALKARLETLGYNVEVRDDNQTATTDADGKGLIVISSTTLSSNVNTKFTNSAIPVICYESYLFDDFKMTSTSAGTHYGAIGSQSQINITDATHPIAAGLSGTQTVYSSANTLTWGTPSSSAAAIATQANNVNRKVIFAYEAGDNMVGMTAPARRVGFFLNNSNFHLMTTNGLAMFDAAVDWAVGKQAPGTPCNDGNPNTTDDVILSDGCTCQGVSCDGAVTGISFYDLNNGNTTPIVDGGTYYLSDLPASYNILASTTGTLESVNFNVTGAVTETHTENIEPYHYAGDPNPVTFGAGVYNFTMTVYNQDQANGVQCDQVTISFELTVAEPCPNGLPEATVASTDESCAGGDGSITFSFNDNPNRTNIEFSIDGGNTYPYNVNDNIGSATIDNLSDGGYDVWVRWGNDECPLDLGVATVGAGQPATPVDQYIQLDGGSYEAGTSITVCEGQDVNLDFSGNGFEQWVFEYSGPNGFSQTNTGTSTSDQLLLSNISAAESGVYNVEYTNPEGCSLTTSFVVTVNACNSNTCDDNLFINGDIEAGTDGFTYVFNASTTSDANSGSQAISICNESGQADQYLPILAGQVYTVNAFAKRSNDAGWTGIGINYYDENWSYLDQQYIQITTDSYQEYTNQLAAPNMARWTIISYYKGQNGCAYIDDICLTSDGPTPSCGTNILAGLNPGFENDFAEWDWRSNESINTSDVFAGSQSGQICTSSGGAGNQTDATPGAVYTLTTYAKITGTPDWAGVGFKFYDANWQRIGQDYSRRVMTSDWAKYTLQAVAPSNTAHIEAFMWKGNNGCLRVDDYCLSVDGGATGPSAPTLQTGKIVVTQADANAWYTVNYSTPFDSDPIVVLGPPSSNSGDPVGTRLRNVTATGFEFQLDEWNYQNGYHPEETLYYLAMMPGNHNFNGVEVEAGTVTENNSYTTHNFGQAFGSQPVVLTSVASVNDANAVATRTRNITATGFQLRLQEEDNSSHADETVNYIAMTAGSFNHGGADFKVASTTNSVTHNWYTVNFGQTFNDPGLIASMQTVDGGDLCGLRYRNLTSTGYEVKVEEEQALDTETSHTSEIVGWVVFSASTTLNLGASSDEELQVEAVKEEEHAVLLWAHNKGDKVDEYIVERSLNGTDFEEIASAISFGTDKTELYESYDLAPETGENTYRIKLMHLDGTVSYSATVSVYYEDLIDFVFFPNPANDFVKVNLEEVVGFENVKISINNNYGTPVKEVSIDKVYSKYHQIDLRNLNEGHYVIWVHVPKRKPVAKQLVVGKI